MKNYILSIIVFMSSLAVFSAQEQQTASSLVHEAQTIASEQDKNIFIIYQASWCSWCKKMIALMQSEELAPIINEYYVLMDLEVMENNKNMNTPGAMELLKEQGGGEGYGIPFWSVMDQYGDTINNSVMPDGRNAGCPATNEEINYLLAVLKQTSNITDAQCGVVAQVFSRASR